MSFHGYDTVSSNTRSNFILQSERRLELGGPQHHSALAICS